MDADSVLLIAEKYDAKLLGTSHTIVGKCPLGVPIYKVVWRFSEADIILEYRRGNTGLGYVRVYVVTEIIRRVRDDDNTQNG
jgi:hypothetical protein